MRSQNFLPLSTGMRETIFFDSLISIHRKYLRASLRFLHQRHNFLTVFGAGCPKRRCHTTTSAEFILSREESLVVYASWCRTKSDDIVSGISVTNLVSFG